MTDTSQLRVTVIVEDPRTERFSRELLCHLGFKRRNLYFMSAPRGQGAADAWVKQRYVEAVKNQRSRNYQGSLRLVAIVDGDSQGVKARKDGLDAALIASGQAARAQEEGIATPVPTWSIETWLLHLLDTAVHEGASFKPQFERAYNTSDGETQAIRQAAAAWPGADPAPASLIDGRAELERIGP